LAIAGQTTLDVLISRMAVKPGTQIHDAAMSWPGVTSRPHRFGGTEYRLARREIGHVHGDYLVDIPFPKNIRNELVAAGMAEPHHILPDTGWVSFYIKRPDQVEPAIALLRRSYDLASAKSKANVEGINRGRL
jgi:Family of unknown function (DUF5519)